MYLIVGLGNPGIEYRKTYHNIGFLTVENLLQELDVASVKKECDSICYHAIINNEKVIIAQPQTYMNLSGNAVLKLKSKYKIENSNIVVIADDIDLQLGVIRYRESGSAGTHNGLRNIVSQIGTDFKRIRIGIGRGEGDLADYVLSKISNQNFNAKLVNFKPLINQVSSQGVSQKSIERALNRIQEFFPSKKDSVIFTVGNNAEWNPSMVGVLKENGTFKFAPVALNGKRNDLYKVVSLIKRISAEDFQKGTSWKNIDNV